MKKLSFILAVLMIMSCMIAFVSCKTEKPADNDDVKTEDTAKSGIAPEDAVLKDMVKAIEEKAPYGDYISEMLYMAEDPDEMLKWTYGVVEVEGADKVADYVITMPSDYCHTLAIIKFSEGTTDDEITSVKDAITTEYLEARASALQMYMPEEYENMRNAIDNPANIWQQYDNTLLVLAVYGKEAPTEIFQAIDDYLGK